MSTLSLRESLETIDARMVEMNRKLDDLGEALRSLISMTARLPDGRTLVNAVGTILNEVQEE